MTDILNRLNEISFNFSVLREMRALKFVTRLIESQHLQGLTQVEVDRGKRRDKRCYHSRSA